MWRMLLPCGKLLGLLFCLLFLISILFLKLTYLHEVLSRTELARLVMGTFFLDGLAKRDPPYSSRSRFCIYVYICMYT